MRAVAINLARRPDRRANLQARWAALGLDVELQILTATDERDNPPPAWWRRSLPAGSWGCWDSHLRALASATSGPLLVLEDDCVFAPGAADVLAGLEVPDDWDLIHLGGQHLDLPVPAGPGLVRPVRMVRSHAYLAAYPRVLAVALRRRRTHVDWAIGRLPIARYALAPPIAGQDDTAGEITRNGARNTIQFWEDTLMTDPDVTPPPAVVELPEVDEATAAVHLDDAGDTAHQAADHPYDPAGDPYADAAGARVTTELQNSPQPGQGPQ